MSKKRFKMLFELDIMSISEKIWRPTSWRKILQHRVISSILDKSFSDDKHSLWTTYTNQIYKKSEHHNRSHMRSYIFNHDICMVKYRCKINWANYLELHNPLLFHQRFEPTEKIVGNERMLAWTLSEQPLPICNHKIK